MAKKNDEPDTTPTRLQHVSGVSVVVAAYKADRLVSDGQFTKPSGKRRSSSGE